MKPEMFFAMFVSFAGFAISASAFRAQEGAPPPFPPPGKLVDVGGWRLHLNCTGQRAAGAPLVILEPGIGDFSSRCGRGRWDRSGTSPPV